MTLPTNETRELSIEELEAIAAGNFLGDAVRWVERKAGSFASHHPLAAAIIGAVGITSAGVGYSLLVSLT